MTVMILDIDGPLNPFRLKKDVKYTSWGGDWNTGAFPTAVLFSRFQHLVNDLGVIPVWGSAWQEEARVIEPILGLPNDMPIIPLSGPSLAEGLSTWKLDDIDVWLKENYPNERVIWIEDEIEDDAFKWASERAADTLIIKTSDEGWSEEEYQRVCEFVRRGM